MYRAVLDTCVLVPSLQRDFVLQLATESAFMPQWSTGVLDELQDVLERLDARRGRNADTEKHRRLVMQMRRVFPGATIIAPRGRRFGYGLSDPHDEHVLHAALMSEADAIVTDDRRSGFDSCRLVIDTGIEILPTHTFIGNAVAAHREPAARALLELFRRRTEPPSLTPTALLERLCSHGDMAEVFGLLRDLISEVDETGS